MIKVISALARRIRRFATYERLLDSILPTLQSQVASSRYAESMVSDSNRRVLPNAREGRGS